jgi:proteasome lid subunit RPN8/RPN11
MDRCFMVKVNSAAMDIFQLPRALWDQIRSHLQANLPEEACGIIAGIPIPDQPGWKAQTIFPVENILHSPTRYRMEPHAQLEALTEIDQAGLEFVGIFHSHPLGPAHPSQTDLLESYYPNVIYLICSRNGLDWYCSGYRFQDQSYQEIGILISP